MKNTLVILLSAILFLCLSSIPAYAQLYANFTASRRSGSAPLEVQFADLSDGDPTSWLWDFGDGEYSELQNPTHIYTIPGDYTVTLEIYRPGIVYVDPDIKVEVNYINVSPAQMLVADFSGKPTSGQSPLAVKFTDQSTGSPTVWLWDFGDNTTSFSQNPGHVYTQPGLYTVTLTVSVSVLLGDRIVLISDAETKKDYIRVESPKDRITLSSGTLNGTQIDVSNPTISVYEGGEISGTLNINVYNSGTSNAAFPVGVTRTWGDRTTSYGTITGNSPPGNAQHTVTLNLTAPSDSGTYYIIIAGAAQTDVAHVMSCTDGRLRSGVWNDGNDVVDWTPGTVQDAIEQGYTDVPWLTLDGSYEDMDTGAAAVKVEVTRIQPILFPTDVAVEKGSGNIYVTDTGNNRVLKLSPAGELLGIWGMKGDDEGEFDWPQSVALDSSGNVYVTDRNNNRVQKFASTGFFLKEWGTGGSGNIQFDQPGGIAVDSSDNVYVVDTRNNRVQKFTSEGELLKIWGEVGSNEGQFNWPQGIAVDSSGNVYVTERNSNRVQKFTSEGVFVKAWGKNGIDSGEFVDPMGVAVDSSGNVYVADTGNNRIQTFSSEGVFQNIYGRVGVGEGELRKPQGVAVNEAGIIYVADTKNNRIQTFLLSHTITAIARDNGSISPSGQVVVAHEASQTFTIKPDEGYHTSVVLVDGRPLIREMDTYTFENVTTDHTIEVIFTGSDHTIKAEAGNNGSISPSGSVAVKHGTDQTFTILPDNGYRVLDVLVDNESVGAVTEYTFSKVTTDHTIVATFAADAHIVKATAGDNGIILPSGNVVVEDGASRKFIIRPAEGYSVLDVMVDNESVGAVAEYTFSNVTADHTISATFGMNVYTITATAGDNGSISPSGEVSVKHGADPTFTVRPAEGYSILNVMVDNESVGAVAEYTFEDVTSDHTIVAAFAMNVYTITATAGDNGSISPSGEVSVKHGADQTFTLRPAEGYNILGVMVDNESVGAVTEYTFENVTADHTIIAAFGMNVYTIAATAGDNGSISPSGMVTVNHGEKRMFTIRPAEGYSVLDVMVDNESVGAVAEYTFEDVTSDHTIIATFAMNIYTITATAGDNGSISPSGTVSVNHGDDQTFTIMPAEAYHVADVLVDDESVGAVTTYTFTDVASDHTINAIFAVNTYIITATIEGNGIISPQGELAVQHGASQVFSINPVTGYHLVEVIVDNKPFGAVLTYTFENVVSDHNIVAVFAADVHSTEEPEEGKNYAWIDLGRINDGFLLTQEEGGDGITEVDVKAGVDCRKLPFPYSGPGNNHMYFSVDDSFLHGGDNEVWIAMEYFDVGSLINCQYDSSGSAFKSTGNIVPGNSGTWKTHVWHMTDARFENRVNGSDFRFSTNGTGDMWVNRVWVLLYQPPFPFDVITAKAGENGTISPSGEVIVERGADRTFIMTPDQGYNLADIMVDSRPAQTARTYTFVNVRADHTIAAMFEINTYTLTASANGNGSISPSGAVTAEYGSSRTFEITPAEGYHIADVLVDDQSVGAVTEYTFENITSNHSIATFFEVDTYIISASTGDNGSISPSGEVAVEHGSNRTFTIRPASGYHVSDVLVDDKSVGAVSTYTFRNITFDHTIEARFAGDIYTIVASAEDNGSISPSGAVEAVHGSDQRFSITPDDGYHVLNVLVDGDSVGSLTTYAFVNVMSDHTIEAMFAINDYVITASSGNNGSISPSGKVGVEHGSEQNFTITPDGGYRVTDVLVDGLSAGPVTTYTFENIASDHAIEAIFAINTYTISATTGANGSISPAGQVIVEHGADQTFTIRPAGDYNVVDVLVDGDSVGSVETYTFTSITADHTIEATFAIDIHTITASAGVNGSISPSGEVNVEQGSDRAFTMTPDEGYHVLDVLVDGGSVGAATEYTFTDVASDHTIEATFGINSYIITATAANNGSISPSGAVTVEHGSDQRFSITPNGGYHVTDVLVDGNSIGAVTDHTFTNTTSDHIIEAIFARNTYTIAATAGNNGSISPSGEVVIEHGTDLRFSITPEQGGRVLDVLVDGGSVGSVTTYVFSNVSSDHTIEARFEVLDTRPPSGSIVINSNSQYTSNRLVTLRLSATDDSGVVSQMRFSNNNASYSAWEGYSTSSQWSLSTGDGRKTVYAQFADEAGNQSTTTISDSITLDTTPPTGSVIINDGDEYTNSTSVALTLSATDGGSGLSQMRFSNDNIAFSSPENYSGAKTWSLSGGDGLKTAYARFGDGVGNWSTVTINDSIRLDTTTPEVVSASPTPDTENIPINAPIEIDFDEEIDESSISVSVSGSSTGDMSGRVTYANGVLTFIPAGNFGDDEDIEVEVTALDLAGNRISYSVGFSTGIGVWPGDTNRDGIVNVLDLLPIGRYWHENGDPRSQEDMTWEIQPAVPWDAVDAAHADADGNGIVDEGDLEAIHQNWGSSHPSTTAPSITPWEREQLAHITAESDSPGIEELRRCLAMLVTPREVPTYSSLGQNYPNPFNPETWIPYQLAEGSDVTIEIYDVSGRLTRVLELGYKDAGVYTEKQRAIYWDGRNNTGEPVSSGIYFYRLKAGDFTSIGKMIVVF